MGVAASVAPSNFESANGSIQVLFDSFLSDEDLSRMKRLQKDLVVYEDIRMAFANYVKKRGTASEAVRLLILNIDQKYMKSLLLKESRDEELDFDSDVILYYMSHFADSPVYRKFQQGGSTKKKPRKSLSDKY